MGRIIKLGSAAGERAKLIKLIMVAVDALSQHDGLDDVTRDISAFIALAMLEISSTVESTVQAWEKRGYWVKADRFRVEWLWADTYGKRLKNAVIKGDWKQITDIISGLTTKVDFDKVSNKQRITNPWKGAWEELQKNMKANN